MLDGRFDPAFHAMFLNREGNPALETAPKPAVSQAKASRFSGAMARLAAAIGLERG